MPLVVAHLGVRELDRLQLLLDLGGRLVLQLPDGHARGRLLLRVGRDLRIEGADALLQLGYLAVELRLLVHQQLAPALERLGLLAQALVLAVFGEDGLLPLDQLHGAHGLGGGVGVDRHVGGRPPLLVAHLPDAGALVVERLLLLLEARELVAHADDAEQRVGLVLVGHGQELRQVEGERLHERVEQLLAALAPLGVGHLERGVLALALHHYAVG